jgi:hypothetical protein
LLKQQQACKRHKDQGDGLERHLHVKREEQPSQSAPPQRGRFQPLTDPRSKAGRGLGSPKIRHRLHGPLKGIPFHPAGRASLKMLV